MTCDRWTDDDDLDCYLECRDFRVHSEFERTATQWTAIPPSKPLPSTRIVWLLILASCVFVDAVVVLGVVSVIEWWGTR